MLRARAIRSCQVLGLGIAMGCDGQVPHTGDAPSVCADGWSHALTLTGAASGPDDCEDFVFTGRVVEPLAEHGWLLDSCPCDQVCAAPDPYELRLDFTEPGVDVPTVPACVAIELYRATDCALTHVVVRNRQLDDQITLALGYVDAAPPGFEWLDLDRSDGPACHGQAGGLQDGVGLNVGVGVSEVSLIADSVRIIETPEGPLEIVLGRAWQQPDGELELSYSLRPL